MADLNYDAIVATNEKLNQVSAAAMTNNEIVYLSALRGDPLPVAGAFGFALDILNKRSETTINPTRKQIDDLVRLAELEDYPTPLVPNVSTPAVSVPTIGGGF